jgi:glucosamine--fructose-6-phosphate aminotransferase (isomerizing)
MNTKDTKYATFALVREMIESAEIVSKFDASQADDAVEAIRAAGKLLMTGEGSSRIFPAKNAIAAAMRAGATVQIITEGSTQAMAYDLETFVVFGASNSGRTKEIVRLCETLTRRGNPNVFGLTANHDTKLESVAARTYVLTCGQEEAIAATKSVVEQALFYRSIVARLTGGSLADRLDGLGRMIGETLGMSIDPGITQAIADAGVVYIAGRNDGVAEELTLKTNEIARKKSDFLEGTYAFHGIAEVMDAGDVAILIDPAPAECEKYKAELVDGVGMKVFAIAPNDTPFPTLCIPEAGDLSSYVELAAGWNLLVEVGLALGRNLDEAERAQKVGYV